MRFKKIMSALLAGSMAATALAGAGAIPASASGETLTFDIQSGGENSVVISADQIAVGDVTVPVDIFIPENPGVYAINLKLQINDGQVAEDGSFGNYGLYFSDGVISNPFCFDSANNGDSSKALYSDFNLAQMNLGWVHSMDPNVNADSANQVGTTSWDSSASWAYSSTFAHASLVVPQDTPAGSYVLDVRTEPYLNVLSIGAENPKYSKSCCQSANETDDVAFQSKALTIVVEEKTTTTTSTTTTETTTTTTETTTTTTETTTTTTETTTTQTTSETTTTETTGTTTEIKTSLTETSTTTETTTEWVTTSISTETTSSTESTTTTTETTETTTTTTTTTPNPSEELWKDDYKIEDGGHYLIIGDVCGAPGQSVNVPVMVYGDPGTAAMRLYFEIGGDAKLTEIKSVKRNYAYLAEMEVNADATPPNIVFAGNEDMVAADGSVIVNLVVTIPENAADGTTYPIKFYRSSGDDADAKRLEVANHDMQWLDPDFYDGSVTVVSDTKTPYLNCTSYILPNEGDTVNLTLFNAYGEVTWSSSDQEIATVDQNGFVIAKKLGSCVITATNKGKNYTCSITVGLFGDVEMNGDVSITDAQLTLQEYTVRLARKDPILSEAQSKIADVNGDNEISVEDAQCILQYYTNMLARKTWITWYDVTGNPKAPGGPEA